MLMPHKRRENREVFMRFQPQKNYKKDNPVYKSSKEF
ncbi:hypothetical protein MED121_18395 [Marinomonas sp. MED121]|nr:hypothetical protein MED121_18395 [Marinomonas sp. MED121]